MSLPISSVYPGPLYNEDGGSIFLRNTGTHIPHYRQQILARFNAVSDTKLKKKLKKKVVIAFLKSATNFSLREWKYKKIKDAKSYCWALTQTVRRSCCVLSGSRE
jgi:hypothetical protein